MTRAEAASPDRRHSRPPAVASKQRGDAHGVAERTSSRSAYSENRWRNYSLFLRGDGLLIGYLECEEFEAAQRRMEETGVNARWQAEMAPFFELPEGSRPDTGFLRLEEIFHTD
jgi:L-rhamnose mutarotase